VVFKMWQFITSFFTNNKKLTLNFISDPKDIVKISINYNSTNSPEFIASVIYALNNGLFLEKIVNALFNENKAETNNILLKLDALYVTDHQNDLIIKPLETFDKNVK